MQAKDRGVTRARVTAVARPPHGISLRLILAHLHPYTTQIGSLRYALMLMQEEPEEERLVLVLECRWRRSTAVDRTVTLGRRRFLTALPSHCEVEVRLGAGQLQLSAAGDVFTFPSPHLSFRCLRQFMLRESLGVARLPLDSRGTVEVDGQWCCRGVAKRDTVIFCFFFPSGERVFISPQGELIQPTSRRPRARRTARTKTGLWMRDQASRDMQSFAGDTQVRDVAAWLVQQWRQDPGFSGRHGRNIVTEGVIVYEPLHRGAASLHSCLEQGRTEPCGRLSPNDAPCILAMQGTWMQSFSTNGTLMGLHHWRHPYGLERHHAGMYRGDRCTQVALRPVSIPTLPAVVVQAGAREYRLRAGPEALSPPPQHAAVLAILPANGTPVFELYLERGGHVQQCSLQLRAVTTPSSFQKYVAAVADSVSAMLAPELFRRLLRLMPEALSRRTFTAITALAADRGTWITLPYTACLVDAVDDIVAALLQLVARNLERCHRADDVPVAVVAIRLLEEVEAVAACGPVFLDLLRLTQQPQVTVAAQSAGGWLLRDSVGGFMTGSLQLSCQVGRVLKSAWCLSLLDYRQTLKARTSALARVQPGCLPYLVCRDWMRSHPALVRTLEDDMRLDDALRFRMTRAPSGVRLEVKLRLPLTSVAEVAGCIAGKGKSCRLVEWESGILCFDLVDGYEAYDRWYLALSQTVVAAETRP